MRSDEVKKLKVAIVDDFLTVDGGAQRVLRVMHEIWPQAPVYTVTYFPEAFQPPLENWDIRTSFVNRLPFRKLFENQYKLFYHIAIEQFDLSEYDIVVSQTYAGYAKGVVVPSDVKHLCYVHNVPRYLWGLPSSRHGRLGFLYKKVILPPLEHYWRIWDRQTAERPDKLVANSQNVVGRVKKFYRRDADVLYPPVDVEYLLKVPASKLSDYFVYFGRLEEYKRVDMAIKACINANEKLKIIGTGSYMDELKSLVKESSAEDSIEFL
ncbi:MAG: glycosyltransferase, partial [Patescibacteria group bacterium]|nr:glycosyltransferase [Patescibacteria group bacterium]